MKKKSKKKPKNQKNPLSSYKALNMPRIKPLQAGIMTNDQKKKLCEKHAQCPKMKQSDLTMYV